MPQKIIRKHRSESWFFKWRAQSLFTSTQL